MKKSRYLSYPYIFWTALFVAAPMAVMLAYAFGYSDEGGGHFTFAYFKAFFQPMYLSIFAKSIGLALACTAVCLAVDYPAVLYMAKLEKRWRNILFTLLIVPMWMNFLLRTYSWMTLLSKTGVINNILVQLGYSGLELLYTNGAVFLGMVYNFLPFMIYPIYSVVLKIPPGYALAAKDLGAGNFTVFRKITLPLSFSGIITGIAMVFIPSVCMFVIPDLLGGASQMYMGKLIQYQFFQKGNWNLGAAFAVILTVVVLAVMFVMHKADSKSAAEERHLW
jgi:spermidine/putrescine transport system permease protein